MIPSVGVRPREQKDLFTWMNRMHRIFSGNNWLAILSIGKPATGHRPSRLPVQERLVLRILLILCIHVHKKWSATTSQGACLLPEPAICCQTTLFHPRMICPVVGGRDAACPKRQSLLQNSGGCENCYREGSCPPGARASRPHALRSDAFGAAFGLAPEGRCCRRLRGSTLVPTLFHGLTLPFPRGRCFCCRTGRPQGASGFTSEAKCCRRFAAGWNPGLAPGR